MFAAGQIFMELVMHERLYHFNHPEEKELYNVFRLVDKPERKELEPVLKNTKYDIDCEMLCSNEALIKVRCQNFCNLQLVDFLKNILLFSPQKRLSIQQANTHSLFYQRGLIYTVDYEYYSSFFTCPDLAKKCIDENAESQHLKREIETG